MSYASKILSTTPQDNHNLILLSNIATSTLKPIATKRARPPNPVCSRPGHASWKSKVNIQRHTCASCFKESAEKLLANPNLTRWDVACLLVREFRNYFCCCCVLEKKSVCLTKICRNGHSFICKERYCLPHKLRLTVCTKCNDPRSGTSFRPCGHRLSIKCDCVKSLEDVAQDPEVVALKESYAVNFLKRAADMQMAGLASLDTETDDHCDVKSRALETESDKLA